MRRRRRRRTIANPFSRAAPPCRFGVSLLSWRAPARSEIQGATLENRTSFPQKPKKKLVLLEFPYSKAAKGNRMSTCINVNRWYIPGTPTHLKPEKKSKDKLFLKVASLVLHQFGHFDNRQQFFILFLIQCAPLQIHPLQTRNTTAVSHGDIMTEAKFFLAPFGCGVKAMVDSLRASSFRE